jgi:hypothetical protein
MSIIQSDKEVLVRNKKISELTAYLKSILSDVLSETGLKNQQSLHAYLATRKAKYINLLNEVIPSAEHYIFLFIKGLKDDLKQEDINSAYKKFYDKVFLSNKAKKYLYIFYNRTYLREYENLSKNRPNINEATMWIGQNNADYGLLITPHFENGTWVNDKSKIRRFEKRYWSIGHILQTGLVIPNKKEIFKFANIDEYLKFFEHILVRNTASVYQKKIAECYSNYVKSAKNPENILLLIPEFRYGGQEYKHEYRLDFCIIDCETNNKIGFELSPWSSHGKLTGTKNKTQIEINTEASENFSKEMKKHKDYFRKHGIFSLIYTDEELANIEAIFMDIRKYLSPQKIDSALQFHIISEFFNN